jgi:hypothetical protein
VSAPFALDPAVGLALRLGLAALLLAACAHKLRDPAGFRRAVAGYRLLPARGVGAAAAGLALAELALGGGLLLPAAAARAALGTAALLALYAAAIGVNLARGRRGIDCGCAGPGARRPLGGGLVARNGVLALAALAAALPPTPRALVWLDGVSVAAGVALAALLYLAVDAALAQSARRAQWEGRAWSTP